MSFGIFCFIKIKKNWLKTGEKKNQEKPPDRPNRPNLRFFTGSAPVSGF
jgi:hypothetical protein